MNNKKRVVITGMGVVSCFGNDVEEFYKALLAGKSGVRPITHFPCEEYPTRFAAWVEDFDAEGYIDKKQARRIDPFIKYGTVAAKKALQQAGLVGESFDRLDKARAGVIIGSGMGGLNTFYDGTQTLIEKGFKRLTPFFIPFIITNMGGAFVAIDLGFMGPNYSVSTACATSNYSIFSAANHIRMGHADVMIAGGSEAAISPVGLAGFVANKALSERNESPETASRPFDRGRDGFVMGEGAGVIILESLEHALARGAPILAEYLGGSVTCDASHITAPRDDGMGVFLAIEKALQDAGVAKEEVKYVNAHATATPLGDIAEIAAIHKLFGPHAKNLLMNATKSMTGHCLGAAGGIEAIATIKAIETQMIHPTINLVDPEPTLNGIDPVANTAKSAPIDVAISNSFGFGGHNSVIVFGKYR